MAFNPEFRSYMESEEFNVLLEECNLHCIRMEDDWSLVFSKTFTLFFGTGRQPLTGILLTVHGDTGRYFLTVFSKVL